MRCLHCESSAGARRPDELTGAEALQLCEDLADAGCTQCNISGGEPLLRRDWPELCHRLTSRGVRVTLVTNGALLDDEVVHTARAAGVSAVALSLDGVGDTHDRIRPPRAPGKSSFREVIQALGTVQKVGLIPAVITHINRWNLDQVPAMHELLRQMGVDHWQVQLGIPMGRLREIREPYMLSPSQLPGLAQTLAAIIVRGRSPRLRITDTIGYYTRLEPLLRSRGRDCAFWTGCSAGVTVVGIDANGDVKGCSCLPRELVAGNVRQRSFKDIWEDESGFAYNTDWHEDRLTGFCATCPYRRICRAGCTSLAWSVTGTVYENPYCLHRVETLSPADVDVT